MKKALVALAVTLLLLAGLPVFAQTQTQSQPYPKEAYYKSIQLLKVWTSSLGYVIQFMDSRQQVSNIYVPLAWFNAGSASKAEIVYGYASPYAVIYWVDGKFDHITLHLTSYYDPLTWGVLENTGNLAASFNVEDVPRNF